MLTSVIVTVVGDQFFSGGETTSSVMEFKKRLNERIYLIFFNNLNFKKVYEI